MPRFHSGKFKAMQKAGEISSQALQKVLTEIKPGITLRELDRIAEDEITSRGASPAFKRVDDYGYTSCINVNQGIVHGIPTDYSLKEGDIVSVDLGAYYDGFNSDQCWTVEVSTSSETDFLNTGEKALKQALKVCKIGNTIGDISHTMQRVIESAGFSVSRELVGHGIGRSLHESPHVPCYGTPGRGRRLKEGMTLAIEVIYQKGDYAIVMAEDGWTLETLDGSLSAVFEHTVGISKEGPLVFTRF